jgi:thymidylate synthase
MELFNALLAKAHLKAVLPAMPEPDFNEELVHAIMDRYEVPKRRLNCIFHMRSIDVGLGLPFNIASYAMLTHMVAQCVNMEVGELVWLGGDVHIYDNHQKLYKILERDPLPLCQIKLNPEVKKIDDFKMSDIEILNYKSHPKITLPVAV